MRPRFLKYILNTKGEFKPQLRKLVGYKNNYKEHLGILRLIFLSFRRFTQKLIKLERANIEKQKQNAPKTEPNRKADVTDLENLVPRWVSRHVRSQTKNNARRNENLFAISTPLSPDGFVKSKRTFAILALSSGETSVET